jgi:hypothetical protein
LIHAPGDEHQIFVNFLLEEKKLMFLNERRKKIFFFNKPDVTSGQ